MRLTKAEADLRDRKKKKRTKRRKNSGEDIMSSVLDTLVLWYLNIFIWSFFFNAVRNICLKFLRSQEIKMLEFFTG